MAKPTHFTIIDIETTGMDRRRDRITEIAIIRFDGEKVVDQFTSLINPDRAVPDHITRITGIDNDMVRDAPPFYEIAREIVEITRDAVFVAHNASFDYSFIQKEFRRLGYTFSKKQICTVKLSRRLLPGLKSYSLGKLCKHLGIENEARHRAFGDAAATLEVLKHLLNGTEEEKTHQALKLEIDLAKLPPNLDKAVVDDLPDETGVYYFHGAQGEILYVGKSTSVRKRILSHFQGAHKTNRATRMVQRIYDVSYTLTGSELVALLLENEEIKRILPPFNRAQRRRNFKIAAYAEEDEQGYINFYTGEYDENKRPLAGFSSQGQADRALELRGRQFQLCLKKYGVEKGPGRCFHHQLHICKGACIEEESPEDYNERARQAMNVLSYGRANLDTFLVVGKGRAPEERSVVWVKDGFYQGYGFADLESLSENLYEVVESLPLKDEIPDVQRIIQGYIKKNPKEVVVWEEPV